MSEDKHASDDGEEARKKQRTCWDWTVYLVKNITIEPTIFFFMFGIAVVKGSSVHVDLLIWKMCNIELGYNETVCDNLEDEKWEDIENEVQREVNDFQYLQTWIAFGPPLLYVFFAGAISDHLGRKPLILIPLIGLLISNILSLINLAFIETLPVEFFWLDELMSVFGGYSVYYLGVYGFGSNFAEDPDDRAHILSRYDGIEATSRIIGTALSPLIFEATDYAGSFSIRLASTFCSIAYLLIFVKEPMVVKENKEIEGDDKGDKVPWYKRAWLGFVKYVIVGTWETLKTIFMKRPNHMRWMILVQFVVYFLYIFAYSSFEVIYLYIIKAFDADGADYSHMTMIGDLLATGTLLFLVPILTGKMRIHESVLKSGLLAIVTAGYFSGAFAATMVGFFCSYWAAALLIAAIAPGRALLTKSVQEDEMGKILSGNAIIFAVAPLAANPVYRSIYDETLETFPSAFILVSAASAAVAFVLNVGIYTQRHRFRKDDGVGGGIEGGEEDKEISSVSSRDDDAGSSSVGKN